MTTTEKNGTPLLTQKIPMCFVNQKTMIIIQFGSASNFYVRKSEFEYLAYDIGIEDGKKFYFATLHFRSITISFTIPENETRGFGPAFFNDLLQCMESEDKIVQACQAINVRINVKTFGNGNS